MNRPFAQIWGLSQGLLGRSNSTAPSLTAVGPNSYLNQHDFLKMLGVAFAVHAVIFIAAELMPNDRVTHIPVRALSFKLGDQDRVAAYAPAPTPAAAAPIAAPVMKAEAPVVKPVERVTPPPVQQAKAAPVEQPKPRQVPVENHPAVPAPAVAPSPQQYVREVGAPSPQAVANAMANLSPAAGTPSGAIGGQGTQTTMTEQTAQAVRARYEQEISGWIQQHKFYPAEAGGREGRAVVRMRIDRAGNVRYYAIEQSTGLSTLDLAALEMIRRANPVPAVPANYPAGNLVEFLIPITFRAPQ